MEANSLNFTWRVRKGRAARNFRVEVFRSEGAELREFLGYVDILPEQWEVFKSGLGEGHLVSGR